MRNDIFNAAHLCLTLFDLKMLASYYERLHDVTPALHAEEMNGEWGFFIPDMKPANYHAEHWN